MMAEVHKDVHQVPVTQVIGFTVASALRKCVLMIAPSHVVADQQTAGLVRDIILCQCVASVTDSTAPPALDKFSAPNKPGTCDNARLPLHRLLSCSVSDVQQSRSLTASRGLALAPMPFHQGSSGGADRCMANMESSSEITGRHPQTEQMPRQAFGAIACVLGTAGQVGQLRAWLAHNKTLCAIRATCIHQKQSNLLSVPGCVSRDAARSHLPAWCEALDQAR